MSKDHSQQVLIKCENSSKGAWMKFSAIPRVGDAIRAEHGPFPGEPEVTNFNGVVTSVNWFKAPWLNDDDVLYPNVTIKE
jgi:hypothetical protein